MIAADGDVDPAYSRHVTSANVSRPAEGRYCISGLDFRPRHVMAVTVGSPLDNLSAGAGLVLPGCPTDTQASFEAWSTATGEATDTRFAVTIY